MMMDFYFITHGGKHFKTNLFGIRQCANPKLCPVAAIERYVSSARAMQIELTQGYFRPTTPQGEIANSCVSSEAMNGRLKSYLGDAHWMKVKQHIVSVLGVRSH